MKGTLYIQTDEVVPLKLSERKALLEIVNDHDDAIAALTARIETQEREMMTCRRTFETAARQRAALATQVEALNDCLHNLEQGLWLQEERGKALAQRVAALERRVAELERLAGFRNELIEKQHGMLASQDERLEELEKATRLTTPTTWEEWVEQARASIARIPLPHWSVKQAADLDQEKEAGELTCEACQLPEDGLRVRNVTMRGNGSRLCAECANPEPITT